MQKVEFKYKSAGAGRPQIVLLGNGPERFSGQASWNELLQRLNINAGIDLRSDAEKEKWEQVPFPLFYELISLPDKPKQKLEKDDAADQDSRLKKAFAALKHESNSVLDLLPSLDADHIFTTNYTYCVEKAFFPKKTSFDTAARTAVRFNQNPARTENGKQKRELYCRLHSGYLAKSASGRDTGIWHIHGECAVSKGIVLGHDRYGRILSRIVDICGKQDYSKSARGRTEKRFTSWPELFLYGDVYVAGFGFNLCEFDLWWLLKRKQREVFAEGKVFFYEKEAKEETKRRLLRSCGVQLVDMGRDGGDYPEFYRDAFADIGKRIKKSREGED